MKLFSRLIKQSGPYGGYWLARLLSRYQPRILMYHRFAKTDGKGKVGEQTLEQQLLYIKKHFRPVTVTQLAEEVYVQKKVQANTVAISVDDGYLDFYQHAYPLFKKHGIPATLYVTTGFIDDVNWLWPDKISWLLEQAPESRAEFHFDELVLSAGPINEGQKQQDWQQIINFLLSIENTKKDQFIAELANTWQLTLPRKAPEQYASCNKEQLLEMQNNGIEIGGHTVNHPSLGQVDETQARFEILECERWLNQHLGQVQRSFCYPNGTKTDYNLQAMKIIEHESNFNAAVTAFADHLGGQHRYAIRRHTGTDNMFQFYKSLTGVELLGSKLKAAVK